MSDLAKRIKLARERRGLSQGELGEAVGAAQPTVAGWETSRAEPGLARLARLARVLGVSQSWLTTGAGDGPDGEPAALVPAPAVDAGDLYGRHDLPVYGSAEGGPDGMLIQYDPIEYVLRPGPLVGVPGAFALYVVGESMIPRFDPADLLLIHPTKPPKRGDDVLIVKREVNGEHSAMVKRFRRWLDDALEVEQFNPPAVLKIPRSEIRGVHLVVGQYDRA